MKWNTPAVAELDVRMTENGYWNYDVEKCIFTNDSNKKEKTTTES